VAALHNSSAFAIIVDRRVQPIVSYDKSGKFSRRERAFRHYPALLSCPIALAVFVNPTRSQMLRTITTNLESRISVRCLLDHASPSTPTMAERIEDLGTRARE
jgi:hypothetical protein